MKPLEIDRPAEFTLRGNIRGLLVEMRPQEWAKNLLVFSGVIFSRSLLDLHDIWASLLGFLIFCAASSGIYLFNDLCDIESDRAHPVKSLRPLAAGELDINLARITMVALFAAAALGSLALSPRFALIIVLYLAACVAYSLRLKNVVILDVIIIASGFVLRAVAGAVLIDVVASEWLVICTSMVALLVGFGKRRHELTLLRSQASSHRRNLSEYSVRFLDSIMAICSGAALITYALYTRADETVERVGSQWMLITIPFVVYGLFRYLFLIHQRGAGGDPVKILFRDRPTALNLLLWIVAVALVIYLPHFLGKG
ncbi:MAG: 4-hydroxybenzoate polyprenyltransferase [Acidobacteria bacterium OLB17]|nr:MAG: 4-hydroxybenzoate polyprenyltransferase [Acidobacteria bacterium OLB17]MCZ2390174.1 decaprenyl-phosphate phosphoribosyltransferase [Acidobacteriota bacterium]